MSDNMIYLICFSLWFVSSLCDLISKLISKKIRHGTLREAIKCKSISTEDLYIGYVVELFRMFSLGSICALISLLTPKDINIQIGTFSLSLKYAILITPFLMISSINMLSIMKNLIETVDDEDPKYIFYKKAFNAIYNKVTGKIDRIPEQNINESETINDDSELSHDCKDEELNPTQ